jgi:hypothetical protein
MRASSLSKLTRSLSDKTVLRDFLGFDHNPLNSIAHIPNVDVGISSVGGAPIRRPNIDAINSWSLSAVGAMVSCSATLFSGWIAHCAEHSNQQIREASLLLFSDSAVKGAQGQCGLLAPKMPCFTWSLKPDNWRIRSATPFMAFKTAWK